MLQERAEKINNMHSALQTKSKEALSSMNAPSILLLIMTSLSDELSIIDMNLSILFEKNSVINKKMSGFALAVSKHKIYRED